MTRGLDERLADVERLLGAARAVHSNRAAIAPAIAIATGLTPQGVELGFASLEQAATDAGLRALISAAGTAAHVHVILSSNVFVAPLRALALARAAAKRVTVRPSARDDVMARALIAAAADPAISLVEERDVAAIGADVLHVYGSDETIAAVRHRVRPGALVRGHGTGMGLAVVTGDASLDSAAEALAVDVARFDQRGCLSPRVVVVEGNQARGASFANVLHERLDSLGARVPRGELSDEERQKLTQWRDALAFAGRVWVGEGHVVALAPSGAPLAIPPPGRHVQVVGEATLDGVAGRIRSMGHFIVALGTDAPLRLAQAAPRHARLSRLGHMQRPPLDGPVDRRSL
ncbi:MAG: proline dehydrogenase [Myxococcota bacterium]|nr:proline dehydrogenase [Myxococcota bacterium]